ncbi:MAG: O-antigen ligase family protein [bacterium]
MNKIEAKKKPVQSSEVFLPWLIDHREKILFIFTALFMLLLLMSQGGASDLKRAPIWAFRGITFLVFLFFYLLEYARPDKRGLPIPSSRQKLFKWASWYLIAFLSINCLTAIAWQNAVWESLTFLMVLAVMLLVSFYAVTKEKIVYMLHILLAIGVIAGLYGLVNYFLTGASSPLDSFFAWHNPAGGYFSSMLVLFLALMLTHSPKSAMGRYSWIGTIILGAALVFTLSRGAWIAAFLAGLLLLILLGAKKAYHKVSVKFALIVLVAIVLGVVLIGGKSVLEPVYHRIISITATKDFSLEGRENFYSGAIGIFKDNSVIGTGLGSFGYVYPQYQKDPRFYAKDPHSFYLRLMCEGGIFGLILFHLIFLCYFHLLKKFFMSRDSTTSGLSAGLIAALTAGLMHLAIDFDDTFPFILINLGVIWVLGMNLLDPVENPAEVEEVNEKKIRVTMAGGSILLSAVIFVAVFHCGRMYFSDSFYDTGKLYSQAGEYEQAEEYFATSLDYFPLNERALSERARALLFLHDKAVRSQSSDNEISDLYLKAQLTTGKLKENVPYAAKSYFLNGLALLRHDDINKRFQGIEDFNTALKKDSMNSPVYYLHASYGYLEFGMKREFRATVDKFKSTYPYELVEEYANTRLDWTDLPDIYQDILVNEAQVLISDKKFDEVKSRFNKVLELEEIRKRVMKDDYSKRSDLLEYVEFELSNLNKENKELD